MDGSLNILAEQAGLGSLYTIIIIATINIIDNLSPVYTDTSLFTLLRLTRYWHHLHQHCLEYDGLCFASMTALIGSSQGMAQYSTLYQQ